jgi:hypothetical protein
MFGVTLLLLHEGGCLVIPLEGTKMTGKGKTTSARVAKKASAVLRDGRSSNRNRSVAASALAQAKGK